LSADLYSRSPGIYPRKNGIRDDETSGVGAVGRPYRHPTFPEKVLGFVPSVP